MSDIRYLPDETCQIPGLAAIYEERFGLRRDGAFVEVGAFDGHTYSNTAVLADLGWRGLYVEPVQTYAQACAKRHARNPNVLVANCAVGEAEKFIDLHVGDILTTADASMKQAYKHINWIKSFETVRVEQIPLTKVLQSARMPSRFDLLVVDVEGGEEGVFNSFSLDEWRPRMMIVEIEDTHPQFQQFPAIVARARALRARLQGAGYQEIFRDFINTIFWDTRQA